MTTKIELSDLSHLVPLVDAGKWDDVNKAIAEDLLTKEAWVKQVQQENPKAKFPVINNPNREKVMDRVLMEATKADAHRTVFFALMNMEFNTMTLLEARRYAVDHHKRQSLRLLDRFVAGWPEELRSFFNNPGNDLDPRVHERTQASELRRMRKKRPGQTPRP